MRMVSDEEVSKTMDSRVRELRRRFEKKDGAAGSRKEKGRKSMDPVLGLYSGK